MWYHIPEEINGRRVSPGKDGFEMASNKKSKPPVPTDLDAEGKKKALATALTQIERTFGAGSIMRLGENRHMEVQAVHTGSLSLDYAIGIGNLRAGTLR